MSAAPTPVKRDITATRIAAALRLPAGTAGIYTFAVVMLVTGVAAAYTLVNGDARVAAALAALPFLLWLLARPSTTIVALGASIPIIDSLTGGNSGTAGYQVAPSDILIVLLAVAIVAQLTAGAAHHRLGKPIPIATAFRPIARPVLQFCAAMVILLAFHFGIREIAKTGQRYELFLLPIIIGAYAVITGQHYRVLKAYVIASTVLAVVWPINNLEMNKNPVGQMIANAAILLIGLPRLRRFLPCLALLIPGLLLTESRGAVLAGILGVVAMLLFRSSNPAIFLRRLAPVVAVAGVAFAFAPADVQQRLTSLSTANIATGQISSAQYSVYIRQQYESQAETIIAAHPWVGVGIGNYYAASSDLSASSDNSVASQDPHDVLLLVAAEGGYIFAASFVVMIGGVLIALRRMRRAELAAAAFGVFVSTFAHGLVDVYWVRATPDLSWLLVGMTCAMWVGLRDDGVSSSPAV